MSYSNDRPSFRGRDGGDNWRGESRDYNRRYNDQQGGGGGGGSERRGEWNRNDGGERRERRPAAAFSESMEIPGNQVGFVIGRGGSNIQDIQSQFSVRVNIDKNSNYSGNNAVSVSGESQKNVDDAINHIRNQIEESQAQRSSGGGQSRY